MRRQRSAGISRASAALLPLASVAVHQLRYLLAYRDGAGQQLQRTGHSYLHSAVPWIVIAAALAFGVFLRRLGQAVAGHTSPGRYTLSFVGLWMACAVGLAAIFVVQELLEGVVATGHAVGLAGVFAYGGWWSIPASGCVGLVLAAILHGARWVLDEVARRCARAATSRWRISVLSPRGVCATHAASEPMLGGWSDRVARGGADWRKGPGLPPPAWWR